MGKGSPHRLKTQDRGGTATIWSGTSPALTCPLGCRRTSPALPLRSLGLSGSLSTAPTHTEPIWALSSSGPHQPWCLEISRALVPTCPRTALPCHTHNKWSGGRAWSALPLVDSFFPDSHSLGRTVPGPSQATDEPLGGVCSEQGAGRSGSSVSKTPNKDLGYCDKGQ